MGSQEPSDHRSFSKLEHFTSQVAYLRYLNSSLTKATNHLETGIAVELLFQSEQKAANKRVHNTLGSKPRLKIAS